VGADPCWAADCAELAHHSCPAQPALWQPTRSHAVQPFARRPDPDPLLHAPHQDDVRGGARPRPSGRLDFQVKFAVESVVAHASFRPSCAPDGTPARLSPALVRPDGQKVPTGPAGDALARARGPPQSRPATPQQPAGRFGDGGQRVKRHGAAVLPLGPGRPRPRSTRPLLGPTRPKAPSAPPGPASLRRALSGRRFSGTGRASPLFALIRVKVVRHLERVAAGFGCDARSPRGRNPASVRGLCFRSISVGIDLNSPSAVDGNGRSNPNLPAACPAAAPG
jgi:hypothetical protein